MTKIYYNRQEVIATHKESIAAVLSGKVTEIPEVISAGQKFINKDNWYDRKELANFYSDTSSDNAVSTPLIFIAETPDKVFCDTLDYLTGGAYHEALHTLYSRRKPLTAQEKKESLNPVTKKKITALLPNKKILCQELLDMANIIEDIRIERNGDKEFSGLKPKLEALNDFVLQLESQPQPEQPSEGQLYYGTILKTFRDLGLGYETPQQIKSLESYDADCPSAVQFVNTTLKPYLDKILTLTPQDNLAAIIFAQEVLLKILEHLKEMPKEKKESQEGDEDSEGKEGDEDSQDEVKEDSQDGVKSKSKKKNKEKKSKESLLDDLLNEQGTNKNVLSIQDALNSLFPNNENNDPQSPYKPFTRAYDVAYHAADVSRRQEPLGNIQARANQQAVTFAAQIRQILMQREQTRFLHGVKQGKGLSERFFTETFASIQSNKNPDKAFYRKTDKKETKAAVTILIDQSGSMHGNLRQMQSLAYVLLKGLCEAKITTAVYAFGCVDHCPTRQDSPPLFQIVLGDDSLSRTQPSFVEIYKDFDEQLNTPRLTTLGKIAAFGTTPLDDLIDYAVIRLRERKEQHKIILVLTDGEPDNTETVKFQIQTQCPKEGIVPFGVGWGQAEFAVNQLFGKNNSVSAKKIDDIPAKLLQFLRQKFLNS